MKNKLFIDDKIGFVELQETFGNDISVVNAARVSYHKESTIEPIFDPESGAIIDYQVSDRDQKLINFLAKNNHITPFFHPILRFRIKMPIFVAREWFRHVVGFARNEVSRRYVFTEPEHFIPDELRERHLNIKQGSSAKILDNNDQEIARMKEYCDQANKYYNNLLEKGVCPEQARMILPQSMYTEFIETASLGAYARLVGLRNVPAAQKEIQVYAHRVSDLVQEAFPVCWKALSTAHELD